MIKLSQVHAYNMLRIISPLEQAYCSRQSIANEEAGELSLKEKMFQKLLVNESKLVQPKPISMLLFSIQCISMLNMTAIAWLVNELYLKIKGVLRTKTIGKIEFSIFTKLFSK